jgi:hypothetical protein
VRSPARSKPGTSQQVHRTSEWRHARRNGCESWLRWLQFSTDQRDRGSNAICICRGTAQRGYSDPFRMSRPLQKPDARLCQIKASVDQDDLAGDIVRFDDHPDQLSHIVDQRWTPHGSALIPSPVEIVASLGKRSVDKPRRQRIDADCGCQRNGQQSGHVIERRLAHRVRN